MANLSLARRAKRCPYPILWVRADRDPALALADAVGGGIGLADLAYQGDPLFQQLADEADLLLVTPAAAAKNTPKRALISSVRERIETAFSN